MKLGAFINQKSALCSIYEAGFDIKTIIKDGGNDYSLDYIETDGDGKTLNPNLKYDFYVINWHNHTLPIRREILQRLRGKKIAIVLEVDYNNNLPMTPDWFDAYMIIDPTKERKDKFFPFPRPIFPADNLKPILDDSKFILGGFGLVNYKFTNEKRFEEVIQNANKHAGECIVRFSFPSATFTDTTLSNLKTYAERLKRLAKSNVDVRFSYDYMPKKDLISWLSEHHANCFPYYRSRPGLSAVTDQAIEANRGIIITECNTFRHLHKYISHYPTQSYEELAVSTLPGVRQMQEDWSPQNFKKQFTNLLIENHII